MCTQVLHFTDVLFIVMKWSSCFLHFLLYACLYDFGREHCLLHELLNTHFLCLFPFGKMSVSPLLSEVNRLLTDKLPAKH